MASRRESKADGPQRRLLRMVNDQRARCKLTTLENVIDHTGFSWVESMVEHARDLYHDYSSSAISDADMNVNILRSPKKSKPKASKKTVAPKKASPYKRSRIPKESTPPRTIRQKVSQAVVSPLGSPESSVSTKVDGRDSTASAHPLKDLINLSSADAAAMKAGEKLVNDAQIFKQTPEIEDASEPDIILVESKSALSRKRKSEADHDSPARKRHSQRSDLRDDQQLPSSVAGDDTASEKKDLSIQDAPEGEMQVEPEVLTPTINGLPSTRSDSAAKDSLEERLATPPPRDPEEVHSVQVMSDEEEEDKEEEEEEVSRVMVKQAETHDGRESRLDRRATEMDDSVSSEESERPKPSSPEASLPEKKTSDFKTPSSVIRVSLDDSMSSNEAKSTKNDDVFSDADADAAASSGSRSSAPKPSLRERIDRFRAIFSPAPRAASSIPRLSPPKTMQSPPRLAQTTNAKAGVPTLTTPAPLGAPASKLSAKASAQASAGPPAPLVNKPLKPVAQATASASTSHQAPTIVPMIKPLAKAPAPAAIAPVVPASSVKKPSAAQASAPTTLSSASVKVNPAVQVKLSSQSKVTASSFKSAAPSHAVATMSMANPFQKAQQQQQQQALSSTSQLRAKTAPTPASTAHIELEEPDSAYSDSDDEETIKKRQQHKPWETKEGLAKALEEQAHIDADMIFGIPYGTVPIDEILPAETEHARVRRNRPRSSSATWSRDGLKQIEIDRYNERMGIEGPGARLPLTVQDDGSGTPSRSHRLSVIAQSAIAQGQVSKKLSSIGLNRGSMSPMRPASAIGRPIATSSSNYPQLSVSPTRPKGATLTAPSSSSLPKSKVSKTSAATTSAAANGIRNVQTNKAGTAKTTAKNPFQNGSTGGNTLHTGRLANSVIRPVASQELKQRKA